MQLNIESISRLVPILLKRLDIWNEREVALGCLCKVGLHPHADTRMIIEGLLLHLSTVDYSDITSKKYLLDIIFEISLPKIVAIREIAVLRDAIFKTCLSLQSGAEIPLKIISIRILALYQHLLLPVFLSQHLQSDERLVRREAVTICIQQICTFKGSHSEWYSLSSNLMNDDDSVTRILSSRLVWHIISSEGFAVVNSGDFFVRLCDAVNDGSIEVRENVIYANLGMLADGDAS